MRLKRVRYFSIKYNEAAGEHLSGNGTAEDGLLLSPLTFDAEVVSLRALRDPANFCCRPFAKSSVSLVLWMRLTPIRWVRFQTTLLLRSPNFCSDPAFHPFHAASRLPVMDQSIWEVNFNHRDDALNALMVSQFTRTYLAAHMLNPIRL